MGDNGSWVPTRGSGSLAIKVDRAGDRSEIGTADRYRASYAGGVRVSAQDRGQNREQYAVAVCTIHVDDEVSCGGIVGNDGSDRSSTPTVNRSQHTVEVHRTRTLSGPEICASDDNRRTCVAG